jgi:DNA polymerase I-like protein with 3'-5' exonuclease and polymerase domains
MTKLVEKEPLIKPLTSLISDIRSLGVFLSTFVQAPLDEDKRMRCSFNLAGTETFRFASSANPFDSGTNLQNIPKGNEDPKPGELTLPNVRRLFIPDQFHTIFDIDLDRADLQVVVWEADDADLKRQMTRGVDLHIMNGILVFGKEPPPEDELIQGHPNFHEHLARYKRERQFAKAFIHGTNYGGGARTMAMTCGITTHQADIYQRKWFAIHPGIKDWHRRTETALMTRREVRNAFGYRRFFFDRIDGLLPQALAWIPQSTVACVINRALLNVAVNVPEAELSIQVHDSLVGQYRTVYEKVILPKIHRNMLITVPYPDPLIIPCGIKTSRTSWGEVDEAEWLD